MQREPLCLSEQKGDSSQDRYVKTKTQQRKDNLKAFLEGVLDGTKTLQQLSGLDKFLFRDYCFGKNRTTKRSIRFLSDWLATPYLPFPNAIQLGQLFYIANIFKGSEKSFFNTLNHTIGKSTHLSNNHIYWTLLLEKFQLHSIDRILDTLRYLYDTERVLKEDLLYLLSHEDTFNLILKKASAFATPTHSNVYKMLVAQIKGHLLQDGNSKKRLYTSMFRHLKSLRKYEAEVRPSSFENLLKVSIENLPITSQAYDSLLELLSFLTISQTYNFGAWLFFITSLDTPDLKQKLLTNLIQFIIDSDNDHFFANNHPNKLPDVKTLIKTILISAGKRNLTNLSFKEIFQIIIFYYKHKHLACNSLTAVKSVFSDNNSSVYILSRNLIRFCFVKYETPWFFIDNFFKLSDSYMNCFIHLLNGENMATFNDLPIALTKKEAHLFINKYHEIKGIAASENLGHVLYITKLRNAGIDTEILREVSNSNFYVTNNLDANGSSLLMEFMHFLVQHQKDMTTEMIRPICDFLNNILQNNISYTIKGRTVKTLLKAVEEWHEELINERTGNFKWKGYNIPGFLLKHNSCHFTITQLCSSKLLWEEGYHLHHCVSSYSQECKDGSSAIFSLRIFLPKGSKRLVTIEVSGNTIVQARGSYNRRPKANEMYVIKEWAMTNNLLLSGYL